MNEVPIKPEVIYKNDPEKKSIKNISIQESKYNPDEGYELEYKKWEDTVFGQEMGKFMGRVNKDTCVVDARLYEYNPKARMYKLTEVKDTKKLKECLSRGGGRLKEDDDDWFAQGYTVPTLGGESTSEYLPMMGGPFYKQLYLYDYLDMHRKCFEAWNHNPLAHRIIKLQTDFTLGRGVKGDCKSKELQKYWDEFVEANNLNQKIKQLSDDLGIYGEVMIRCFTNDITGALIIREIDPSTVWEIITEPDDIETVYYYHQQYPTAYQMYTPANIPITKYIIRQIPAEEMIHKKINVVSNEKRGRSDLFCVLGWLKRLKDFYTARVIRAQVQCNFVWDIMVKGTDTDVQTAKDLIKYPPNPGANFIHNEAIELKPSSTNIGAGDAKDDGEMLLTLIATGVGIPKEYLGLSSSTGGRATALVASEPSAKKFQERQYVIEDILRNIYKRFLKQLEKTGRLRSIPEEDREIEFTFPEIAAEDRSAKLKDVGMAESMGWISKQTAAEIATKELQITTYDYEQEQADIATETGKEIMITYAQVPKGIPAEGIEETEEEPKDDIVSAEGKEKVKDELRKI